LGAVISANSTRIERRRQIEAFFFLIESHIRLSPIETEGGFVIRSEATVCLTNNRVAASFMPLSARDLSLITVDSLSLLTVDLTGNLVCANIATVTYLNYIKKGA
jgi:hypothetical protein